MTHEDAVQLIEAVRAVGFCIAMAALTYSVWQFSRHMRGK